MCDGEGLCGWLPVEIGLGETNLAAFHAQITRTLPATGLGSADEPDEDDDEEE
jgi:hypothetical protein